MNRHINTFDTYQDYENYVASDSFYAPNVAYITETEEVEIVSECEPIYEWRDTELTVCRTGDLYKVQEKYESTDCGHTYLPTEETREVLVEENACPMLIEGTLVNGTSSFSFTLNGDTTVNALVYEKNGQTKFSYNYTGGTITSLENAFSGKTELVSVDSFSAKIDPDATTARTFKGCTNLTTPFFFNGQTEIGNSCFSNCTSMSGTLAIPSTVTNIGSFAFSACGGLTGGVSVPEGVTTLSASSFQNCSGLTSIVLPSTVTKMASNYLKGCSSLLSITVNAVAPPDASSASFFFDDTNNCPIYVPAGSVEDYKAASGWSTYATRIQAITP